MSEHMTLCYVTADLSDDDMDLPSTPGIILRGTVASVRMSALLWGEPVNVVAVHDLAHRENLLRRAHDAMTSGEPDGTVEWDQLVAEIEKEIGHG